MFVRRNKSTSSDPFYSLIQEGISQQFQVSKVNLLLNIFDQKSIERPELTKMYQMNQIHGSILIGADYDKDFLLNIKKLDFPTVLVDSSFPGLISVNTNNFQGAEIAVDHLVVNGHTRISFLSGPLTHQSIKRRYDGFLSRLRSKVGSEANSKLIKANGVSINDGYEAMIQDSLEGYTAIFASTDKLAIGALKALNEKGIKVPDDISIIGFDNIEWSLHTNPPLTTINIPKQQVGTAAVRLFLNIYEVPELNGVDLQVNTNLVQRNSVRNIKA